MSQASLTRQSPQIQVQKSKTTVTDMRVEIARNYDHRIMPMGHPETVELYKKGTMNAGGGEHDSSFHGKTREEAVAKAFRYSMAKDLESQTVNEQLAMIVELNATVEKLAKELDATKILLDEYKGQNEALHTEIGQYKSGALKKKINNE